MFVSLRFKVENKYSVKKTHHWNFTFPCILIYDLGPLRTIYLSNYCASYFLAQPNFRRYYFYFVIDQAQIFLDHFNVLDEHCGEISSGFDNR